MCNKGECISGEFGYPDAVPEHEDIFADMNAVYDWNFANSETKSSVMNTAADAGGPLQVRLLFWSTYSSNVGGKKRGKHRSSADTF